MIMICTNRNKLIINKIGGGIAAALTRCNALPYLIITCLVGTFSFYSCSDSVTEVVAPAMIPDTIVVPTAPIVSHAPQSADVVAVALSDGEDLEDSSK